MDKPEASTTEISNQNTQVAKEGRSVVAARTQLGSKTGKSPISSEKFKSHEYFRVIRKAERQL